MTYEEYTQIPRADKERLAREAIKIDDFRCRVVAEVAGKQMTMIEERLKVYIKPKPEGMSDADWKTKLSEVLYIERI